MGKRLDQESRDQKVIDHVLAYSDGSLLCFPIPYSLLAEGSTASLVSGVEQEKWLTSAQLELIKC